MKIRILIVVACMSLIETMSAQITISPELESALLGKEKFNEVKTTVNDYYNAKLSKLSLADSAEKKSVLRQMKKWNRLFWINEHYTDASGKVGSRSKADMNACLEMKRAEKNQSSNRSQTSNWTQVGPLNGDLGIGRIDEIAFDPYNQNIIYVGSPHGGLFKTLDGGANWFPIGDFLPSLGISGIAIDPTNTNIVYALTGDGNSGGGCFNNNYCINFGQELSNSSGVYKSYDGGGTWFKTGVLSEATFRGRELVIDPANPQVLIAATTAGIYRTTNGGVTWNNSLVINAWDVKMRPGNADTVYAASTNAFYRSTNGGLNFDAVSVPGIVGANRISIAVTPANPRRVVLLAGPVINNTTFTGVFSSANSGASFTLMAQTPNVFSNTIGNNVFNDQSAYDNCIYISHTDENLIYAGGVCVWRSTDGGSNWGQISAYWPSDAPYMHPDIQTIKINPLNGNIYVGNDGGFYKGIPIVGQFIWQLSSYGISASQFYRFEHNNGTTSTLGGTQDNGILQQANPSSNFFSNITFGDGFDVMTDHPWKVAGGQSDDVYVTVNTGATRNGSNISVPGNPDFFGNLAIDPSNEEHIYIGYPASVYESNNKGANWTAIGASGGWCIEMCPSNAAKFYTAGAGGMWRRNNGAWTAITPPAPYVNTLKITDIHVLPNSEDNLVISVGGLTANVKVFISFNGGGNWNNISYNLPNVPIFCITRDASEGIYVGTSIGVFYKAWNSGTWQPYNNGLPPTPVTKLQIEQTFLPPFNYVEGTHIQCSTFGRGIWRAPLNAAACTNVLVLTADDKGKSVWQASNLLLSSSKIKGGEGTDVKYTAGNKIVLQNGFKVEYGSKFRTVVQGCQ